MSDLDIALCDASIGDTPAERNFRREVDASLTAFKLSADEQPPWPTADGEWAYDAAVITGSQTAVYDHETWMETLAELLRDLHELDIPLLGVCWGHQFIAQTFGGCVSAMDEYELGYQRIERYDSSPLFADFPAEFIAFETHSDEVVRLPPNATELAGNSRSCQAFSLGTVYGVQFHPEYDLKTVKMVTDGKREEGVSESVVETVLTSATPSQHAKTQTAKRVFENFLSIVEQHQ
ncbi:type 1 glutamine amidotransferase [Haloquadratum walsbyi]|uniref:Glutamine amidotransferase (Homolog to GMP synthase subunit A) n=1 Tax=Haloquadratum walsbyi (strain DSM 16854 / JCM 12705 / C23) TaxID=768065 RepID=G0LM12_HALWC|nr:type 1 glutamine amidotransferase [Haloquadratum walsbyi]CCC41132.1 glutamine amidotransferase (homolog to GMP synthase subunit A) [Haloquadratum walsbyi C23]